MHAHGKFSLTTLSLILTGVICHWLQQGSSFESTAQAGLLEDIEEYVIKASWGGLAPASAGDKGTAGLAGSLMTVVVTALYKWLVQRVLSALTSGSHSNWGRNLPNRMQSDLFVLLNPHCTETLKVRTAAPHVCGCCLWPHACTSYSTECQNLQVAQLWLYNRCPCCSSRSLPLYLGCSRTAVATHSCFK